MSRLEEDERQRTHLHTSCRDVDEESDCAAATTPTERRLVGSGAGVPVEDFAAAGTWNRPVSIVSAALRVAVLLLAVGSSSTSSCRSSCIRSSQCCWSVAGALH